MHISEGFLPISHCIGWAAAAAVPTIISVRAISRDLERKRENRVLLAASAAFLFTLSSLRMPSLTGSSSHPTGTAVGTYLFGPRAMPALALITLIFQALLLAHGGLTTLGANLFSLGIAGPWAMWGLLRLMLKIGWSRDRSIFISTVAGDLATYVTTAAQLGLAYPSAHGGFLGSFLKFLGVFLITQIPIAIAEGMLTVALLRALAASEVEGIGTAVIRGSSVWKSGASVVGVLALLVAGMYVVNEHKEQIGTDDRAENTIQALRPGYHPIAVPVYTPGKTAEGLLFTAQGAAGVLILGWVIYRLRRHGKNARHRIHVHAHLNDIAFTNRWRHRNPWEKVLFGGGFLLVAMLVPPLPWCLAIAAIVTLAATAGARIPVRSWLTVLAIPVSFAVMTAIGIAVEAGGPASHLFLRVDWNAVPLAAGLLVRSVAAVCCLAFIGWTTPLMELIPVFGKAGIPPVLVDLALTIYRFLFVMATTLSEMRRAQSWRMGKATYQTRLRALSMLAGGLFVRCVDRVRRLEEGMEARGYEGRLWVLSAERGLSPALACGIVGLQASVFILGKGLIGR
jgi:cobalamin biosynthesis protein CbiM/cobalt ECF transporter T component CbiQ